MNPEKDAYGNIIHDLHTGDNPEACEIIERDDGYVESSSADYLFTEYENWDDDIKQGLSHASGRVLDIGCGAGRHSLYVQEQGMDVVGIDVSPLAVQVSSDRGVEHTEVCSIDEVNEMKEAPFDTILLLGNNFGLLGTRPVERLTELYEATTDKGRIITEVRDHTITDNEAHLAYHKYNESRNRLPGCLRMRVRYQNFKTDWFDYLFLDYNQFQDAISDTPWTETQKYVTEKGFTSILE